MNFFYGICGSGKSSLVEALTKECKFEDVTVGKNIEDVVISVDGNCPDPNSYQLFDEQTVSNVIIKDSEDGNYYNIFVGYEHESVYRKRKNRLQVDNFEGIRAKLDAQTKKYEGIFKNEFVLKIKTNIEEAQADIKEINRQLKKLQFTTTYQFDVNNVTGTSDYARILEYADYRNYMEYEVLVNNEEISNGRLSKLAGYNSGAGTQIPYTIILSAALAIIYNARKNSTRLVFIDEPFEKMSDKNIKIMLDFFKTQEFQVIFCAPPNKLDSIGKECDAVIPIKKINKGNMILGAIKFYE